MKKHWLSMNSLRIRFAMGFSILFTLFLAIALFIIYFSYADFRKEAFYKRLKDRAITTFKLLVEVEQIDTDLLRVIDRNTLNSLYDEKVLIFENGKVVYSSIDDKIIRYDTVLLQQIKKEKEVYTTQQENELAGIYIRQNNKDYILLSAAYDNYGRSKRSFLKWTMITVYFSGLAIGWLAIFLLVRKVIQPLDNLNKEIQNISPDNLQLRLQQSGQGEEVDKLATNFNQLLERLQESFNFQKDFVHYASHELRTPLAAMMGLTENALNKTAGGVDYPILLNQLFLQQQNLSGITNSLLLLSDKKLGEHDYPWIRMDELVFRSVDIMQNVFPQAGIQVSIEGEPIQEDQLLVQANEPLLLMALNNLLKNAIQYASDNKAVVNIRIFGKLKEIEFLNEGDFFSSAEKEMIFAPFYRASNAKKVKGHGMGLPLVKQIAQLHHATIKYRHDGLHNIFTFCFPDHEEA